MAEFEVSDDSMMPAVANTSKAADLIAFLARQATRAVGRSGSMKLAFLFFGCVGLAMAQVTPEAIAKSPNAEWLTYHGDYAATAPFSVEADYAGEREITWWRSGCFMSTGRRSWRRRRSSTTG